MSRTKGIFFFLNVTTATIALGAVAAQASVVSPVRSTAVIAQVDQNNLEQNNLDQNAPEPRPNTRELNGEPPAPAEAPLETIPNTPETGTTLPSPLDPTPNPPAAGNGSASGSLNSNETQPTVPETPDASINNGVVPDNGPARIQPSNNLPNNNVPDPRQNVPNQSIDTTPNSAVPNQNGLNPNAY